MRFQVYTGSRALFSFNSTNAEGWGLYSEYIMLPNMPKEGQLISLQFRLLRAARAFLDPELQAGKVKWEIPPAGTALEPLSEPQHERVGGEADD